MNTLLTQPLSDARLCRSAWVTLGLLLILNVPLFLCMRLNGDATYYDLQVQCLNEGGVLYRDMLEPNLPGVVWIHGVVRGLAGWSSVALRTFDLAALSGIAALLVLRVGSPSLSRVTAACQTLAIFWFYLSLSAWSHCQRDLWMMMPAMAAVALRCRTMSGSLLYSKVWTTSILEGALWGCAFWIKPHIAIPAIAAISVSLLLRGLSRRSLTSVCGVLIGGVLVGTLGSAWLLWTGAWTHFWETLLEWNPEYLASRQHWNPWPRYVALFQSFAPWSWCHLVALPYSLALLGNVVCRRWQQRRSSARSRDADSGASDAMLAATYLGWFGQCVVMQHPFSYVHVPPVILAIAVVARIPWPLAWKMVPRTSTTAFFLLALVTSPCARPSRLAAWKDCVIQGPSLASRVTFQARPGPYWSYYPALVEFLQQQEVSERDLFVYSSMLIPLYRDLDLRPPHRFVLTDVQGGFFQSRRGEIRAAIASSPHRFVVSDLSESGLTAEQLDDTDPTTGYPRALSEELRKRYPTNLPVAFRSGWFVVHSAQGGVGLDQQ